MKQPPALALLLLQVWSPCESIAGDLLEEFPGRSRRWFWWETMRTLLHVALLGVRRGRIRCIAAAIGGYAVTFYIGMVSSNVFGEPAARLLPHWVVVVMRDVVLGVLAATAGGYVAAAIDRSRGLSGTMLLILLSCCSFAVHAAVWPQGALLVLGISGMSGGGFLHAYQRRCANLIGNAP